MKCVLCELPVRLAETTDSAQATTVSATALYKAVKMLGGDAIVNAKLRDIVGPDDDRMSKKHFESDEDLALSFNSIAFFLFLVVPTLPLIFSKTAIVY